MKHFPFILLAGLLTLASCSSSDELINNEKPLVICPTVDGMSIVKAQNNFSCNFFKQTSAASEEPNMVISPLSLTMALSMTANGAANETLSEIIATLGYGSSLDEVNALNRLLLNSFPQADKKVTVSFANSIWIDNDFPVLDSFKKINRDAYDAEIRNVDIDTDETMNLINRWADKNTNGLIKKFLDKPYDESCKLALLNALYFKGEWDVKFDKEETTPQVFHNADGTEPRVRMMHKLIRIKALQDDGLTAATLPYGNGSFSINLVLPDEDMTIDECISMLDGERLLEWHEHFTSAVPQKVSLALPRFDIQTGNELNDILKNMGIKSAFSKKADFSGISESPLYIGSITQKARIIVDEEGTEAAAVTGSNMESSAIMYPTDKLSFDRPFVFYITENSTSSILFIGKVTKL